MEPSKKSGYGLSSPVNVNSIVKKNVCEVLDDYMERCSDIDSTHWLCGASRSTTYRITDFISEAAFINTDYYKEMFTPYDLHYGAQAVLIHEEVCVGMLTLFRIKDSCDFTDDELFFLDCLKDHLSIRLYKEFFSSTSSNQNVPYFCAKYNLTSRECEILEYLFQGLQNEVISKKLFISDNTLRKHIYNIFAKLNIKHRWELHYLT